MEYQNIFFWEKVVNGNNKQYELKNKFSNRLTETIKSFDEFKSAYLCWTWYKMIKQNLQN